MVWDIENDFRKILTEYANYIPQIEELSLRQTLIQLRNSYETSQYELLCLAKALGYYDSTGKVEIEEIRQIRNIFCEETKD